MASAVRSLAAARRLPALPPFVDAGLQYEVLMGSSAYGVAEDDSDWDVYGFCIPPRDYVFPHLRGEIDGFSTPGPRFDQYQQHHVDDPTALGGRGRRYDVTVYSIVKFFKLCLDNNPNIIDSLFVPDNCVLFATPIGRAVRAQRHAFLHKGAWHKFKGYAFGQLHKLRSKRPVGGRRQTIERFGYDVKFAYHIVRLLNEVEQILSEQTLRLDRNREQLKAIRRGDWSLAQIEAYFVSKERELESLYTRSALPNGPDEDRLRRLLADCLNRYYDDDVAVSGVADASADAALAEIEAVLTRYRRGR